MSHEDHLDKSRMADQAETGYQPPGIEDEEALMDLALACAHYSTSEPECNAGGTQNS